MTAIAQRNTLLQPRIQRHRRLRYSMAVEVRSDALAEHARCQDISAGGLFVDSGESFPIGSVVRLSFQLDSRSFEAQARIIHAREGVGFGARFLDLTATDRNHILRFVHRERATREAERLLRHDGWIRPR